MMQHKWLLSTNTYFLQEGSQDYGTYTDPFPFTGLWEGVCDLRGVPEKDGDRVGDLLPLSDPVGVQETVREGDGGGAGLLVRVADTGGVLDADSLPLLVSEALSLAVDVHDSEGEVLGVYPSLTDDEGDRDRVLVEDQDALRLRVLVEDAVLDQDTVRLGLQERLAVLLLLSLLDGVRDPLLDLVLDRDRDADLLVLPLRDRLGVSERDREGVGVLVGVTEVDLVRLLVVEMVGVKLRVELGAAVDVRVASLAAKVYTMRGRLAGSSAVPD